MKALIWVAVIAVVAYLFLDSRRTQTELRGARETRQKAEAEQMYARQEQRNQEIRGQLHQQALQNREAMIRANAAEHDRIAREFPDAYRELTMKLGRSLENCLVTRHDSPFTSQGKDGRLYKSVTLVAKCGPTFEEELFSG